MGLACQLHPKSPRSRGLCDHRQKTKKRGGRCAPPLWCVWCEYRLLLWRLSWFFCRFFGISFFFFLYLLFLGLFFCLVSISRLFIFFVRANCVGFLAASAALAGLLFGAAGTRLRSSTGGSSCRCDGYTGQKTRNAETGEDSLHLLAVHDALLSRRYSRQRQDKYRQNLVMLLYQ